MSQELSGITPRPEGTIVIGGALIPVENVELIVGESGISLSGGEMLIWKRTVVVAGGKRHVSRKLPGENQQNFDQWVALCPRAVGIRPDGSVALPRIDPESDEDPLELLGKALLAVKRELGSQVLRGFVWAVVLLLAGIGVIIAVVAYNVQNVQNPNDLTGVRFGFLGLALVVCAFLLGGRATWLSGRRRRIVRVMQDLMHRGELNAPLLAAAITSPSPGTARQPAVSAIPATLSILAICLSICPFVGLVLALIALGITFRKPSWARVLAIISLVIAGLMSAFVIYQIANGR